jgi:hypothetical protein
MALIVAPAMDSNPVEYLERQKEEVHVLELSIMLLLACFEVIWEEIGKCINLTSVSAYKFPII